MKVTSCFLLLLALLAAACQQEPADPKLGVERAIRDYLATRPGLALDNMEVEVEEVTLQGEQAEAKVHFRSRAGEGEMTMRYRLRRQGEGWVVEGRSLPPGEAEMPLPPGHPPTGQPPPAPPEKPPRSSR